MRSRQAGVTFIGWVILLIPLAILGFAGIKLSTLYMNQYKVAKVMQQIAADAGRDGSTVSPQSLRNELERRFDVESIAFPTPEDIMIAKDGDNWVMTVDYDRETSLFGNLSLLVHFNKRAVVQ